MYIYICTQNWFISPDFFVNAEITQSYSILPREKSLKHADYYTNCKWWKIWKKAHGKKREKPPGNQHAMWVCLVCDFQGLYKRIFWSFFEWVRVWFQVKTSVASHLKLLEIIQWRTADGCYVFWMLLIIEVVLSSHSTRTLKPAGIFLLIQLSRWCRSHLCQPSTLLKLWFPVMSSSAPCPPATLLQTPRALQ